MPKQRALVASCVMAAVAPATEKAARSLQASEARRHGWWCCCRAPCCSAACQRCPGCAAASAGAARRATTVLPIRTAGPSNMPAGFPACTVEWYSQQLLGSKWSRSGTARCGLRFSTRWGAAAGTPCPQNMPCSTQQVACKVPASAEEAKRTSGHCDQHAVARRNQARCAHSPPDGDQEHAGEALAAERIALPHKRLRGAAHVCMLTDE